jgi:hypothetical protein
MAHTGMPMKTGGKGRKMLGLDSRGILLNCFSMGGRVRG